MPVRHFGAVLSMEQWEDMAKRLTDAGTEFVIEPYIRFRARSSPTWRPRVRPQGHQRVDSHNVPVRHFGAVLSMEQWEDMAKRLTDAGTEFVIEPYIRFKGEVGEQATMFFLDPSGNAQFKAFKTWIPCSPNNLSNQVSCR